MKHFKSCYNYLENSANLLEEAAEKGLEFRLGEFFYDPSKRTYNEKFREKWIKERENFFEICDNNEVDMSFRYRVEEKLAVISYIFFNPRKAGRHVRSRNNE